jgi:hypothetical protein
MASPPLNIVLKLLSGGADDFPERSVEIIPGTKVLLGRASKDSAKHLEARPDNLWICSPVVSRTHARFSYKPGNSKPVSLASASSRSAATTNVPRKYHVTIEDMGSTHGTFVDGKRCDTNVEYALENDSRIRFGIPISREKGKRSNELSVKNTRAYSAPADSFEPPEFSFMLEEAMDKIPSTQLRGANWSPNSFKVPEDSVNGDESDGESYTNGRARHEPDLASSSSGSIDDPFVNWEKQNEDEEEEEEDDEDDEEEDEDDDDDEEEDEEAEDSDDFDEDERVDEPQVDRASCGSPEQSRSDDELSDEHENLYSGRRKSQDGRAAPGAMPPMSSMPPMSITTPPPPGFILEGQLPSYHPPPPVSFYPPFPRLPQNVFGPPMIPPNVTYSKPSSFGEAANRLDYPLYWNNPLPPLKSFEAAAGWSKPQPAKPGVVTEKKGVSIQDLITSESSNETSTGPSNPVARKRKHDDLEEGEFPDELEIIENLEEFMSDMAKSAQEAENRATKLVGSGVTEPVPANSTNEKAALPASSIEIVETVTVSTQTKQPASNESRPKKRSKLGKLALGVTCFVAGGVSTIAALNSLPDSFFA